jgi:RNA polymerase-binding transcription factor DksA
MSKEDRLALIEKAYKGEILQAGRPAQKPITSAVPEATGCITEIAKIEKDFYNGLSPMHVKNELYRRNIEFDDPCIPCAENYLKAKTAIWGIGKSFDVIDRMVEEAQARRIVTNPKTVKEVAEQRTWYMPSKQQLFRRALQKKIMEDKDYMNKIMQSTLRELHKAKSAVRDMSNSCDVNTEVVNTLIGNVTEIHGKDVVKGQGAIQALENSSFEDFLHYRDEIKAAFKRVVNDNLPHVTFVEFPTTLESPEDPDKELPVKEQVALALRTIAVEKAAMAKLPATIICEVCGHPIKKTSYAEHLYEFHGIAGTPEEQISKSPISGVIKYGGKEYPITRTSRVTKYPEYPRYMEEAGVSIGFAPMPVEPIKKWDESPKEKRERLIREEAAIQEKVRLYREKQAAFREPIL